MSGLDRRVPLARPPRSMGLVGRLVGSVRAVQARHGVLHYVPDLPQSRTFGLDSSTKRRSHVGHSHVCDSSPFACYEATACAPRIIPDRGITRAFSIYRRLSPDSRTPRYRRAIAISASLRFPRNFGGKRIDLVSLYSVNN